jgi:actin-related protein 8
LKRDDQYLAFRLANEEARIKMTKSAKDRDRARAMDKSTEEADAEAEAEDADAMDDEEEEEESPTETAGSKVIVIHVGSQNLRIGLSSDALPKTMPMVIARKSNTNESDDREEPKPKRFKRDDGTDEDPEKVFGPEVSSRHPRGSSLNFAHYRTVVLSIHQDVRGAQGPNEGQQATYVAQP